jgi:tetratricopeptide (TPR) repeat protein
VRGPSVRLLRELAVPYALFAAIALPAVLKAKGYLGAPYEPLVQDLVTQLRGSQPGFDMGDAFALSVVNQGLLFFRYLLLWLVPYPGWMSVDLRPAFPTQIWGWPHMPGFVLYLAYPVVAVALLRKGGAQGVLGFGLLFPWLLALTEMATVRIQEPFVLYRSYLWMSGLPAVLPALLRRVPAKWSTAVAVVACTALVPAMQDRLDSFSSGLKLWDDVVNKNTDTRAPFAERGYHNRGLAYLQSKRYAEARQDFNRAIEINARDADAYMGRGTLLSRTGKSEQALIDFDRAIEIDPNYAEAYAKRCFAKMLLDRPREALADCEKAAALDPRHRDAFTNLGVVYAALNRTEDAATSYRRALALDARNGDANYNYGVLLAVTGRGGEARYHLGLGCEARVSASCDLLARMRRAR